jgi:hypothetical protein
MKKVIMFLIFCCPFIQGFSQTKEFQWLIGTWKMKEKNIYEVWKASDGQSLEGISYRLKGNDTIVMEQMKLQYANNAFHYVPDVAGEQASVDFKITQYDARSFRAENPEHDFPKIIRYIFSIKKDQPIIEAAIEGDGKIIPYVFEKVH